MATDCDCAENIVLIGFMGAGKSTVGRLLAQKSGRYFLDADTLIESEAGRRIDEIFKKEGEHAFREMERRCARWLAACVRGSVISTGGGMASVVEHLARIGTVVYLKLPWEEIVRRLTPQERRKRPLFSDLKEAKRRFERRRNLYETQARLIVDASRPPDEVVEEIIRNLPNVS